MFYDAQSSADHMRPIQENKIAAGIVSAKEENKKKKAMSGYIPPELFPNILARLPVNDVLRCTIVCKSWYSLITSSSVTSLHLKLSTPNQTTRILIQYILCGTRTQHYALLDQNQTLNNILGPDPLSTREACDIIGCFNGLVLMQMESNETAVLWNPSLRKSVILPKPIDLSKYYWHTLGFGFLPATNDYKIVSFSYPRYYGLNKVKVQMYELSTGSWRDIAIADKIPIVTCTSRQAFLKYIVHWPAYSRDNRKQPLIGLFNMKNEKFGTLMVPSVFRFSDFSLSTYQESLCLVYARDNSCSIWVMKEYGATHSWANLFNINIGCHVNTPVSLTGNGEILLETCSDCPGSEFVLSDLISNKVVKDIKPSTRRRAFCFVAHSYVESLKDPYNNEGEDKGCKKVRVHSKWSY